MNALLPDVSIVVPAYNAAATIGEMIRSVLAQSHENFELVICDDASTDRTVEIIDAYQDPRIRLVRNEHNSGEGITRDQAIAHARGRWVAMLDADDAWTPERLDTLLTTAEAHPGAIVFDEIMECHDTPEGMRPWHTVQRGHNQPSAASLPHEIDFCEWINWQRTLIKPLIPTAFVREHSIKHSTKRYSADLEFFLTLIGRSRAKLWYVPRPMYLYRVTPGSMSVAANRHTLVAETIEESIALFAHDSLAVHAIHRKIATVRKTEAYQAFFSHLMHGRLAAAAKLSCRHPWMIMEFVRRSIRRIPYHLSRWRHGGRYRRTT
jgi:glycosyltransferase involved in cell wall biosynthesis